MKQLNDLNCRLAQPIKSKRRNQNTRSTLPLTIWCLMELNTRIRFSLILKNMEHFQWVLALTRLISAIWRKGGKSDFLIDELKSVFDPKGGYYKKGGVYMPSLVAEIGHVIEKHLRIDNTPDELKTFIEEKEGIRR
jgi:hypothetical protein